jgi:hypothetical protein
MAMWWDGVIAAIMRRSMPWYGDVVGAKQLHTWIDVASINNRRCKSMQ